LAIELLFYANYHYNIDCLKFFFFTFLFSDYKLKYFLIKNLCNKTKAVNTKKKYFQYIYNDNDINFQQEFVGFLVIIEIYALKFSVNFIEENVKNHNNLFGTALLHIKDTDNILKLFVNILRSLGKYSSSFRIPLIIICKFQFIDIFAFYTDFSDGFFFLISMSKPDSDKKF
jgi:hypothetical protein